MRWLYYTFLALFSVGMLGLVGVAAAAIYLVSYFGSDLPDYSQLKSYDPPVLTRVYAGDGRLMEEYAQEKRVFVPIEAMPDLVKHAYIAAEDKNFYTHQGIDYVGIARAALKNFKNPGKRPEGASTITQQVAKNFLLSSEVSYKRKIREAILAYRMEKAMGKDKLLELYLNEIFLGQRSYGVAAAALSYFNKSLEELSIEEAAYLAALPKAPNNYHPIRDHEAALERRNYVIDRMDQDGYIEEAEADIAKAKPLLVVKRTDSEIVEAPYFAEEVRRELQDRYGEDALYKGGLAVRTSADPRLQAIAQTALRDGLIAFDRRRGWRGPVAHWDDITGWQEKLTGIARPPAALEHWVMAVALDSSTLGLADGRKIKLSEDDAKWTESKKLVAGDVVLAEPMGEKKESLILRQVPKVNGALVALDPHTGRVLAMQGGWSFGESSFNRVTQAKRQPGSAFKPFIYLAALDKGFTPATLVLDAPMVIDQGPGLPKWRPGNYNNEYYGPTPIRIGVEKSRNLMTVRIAQYIGMPTVAEYAEKFGITEKMPLHLANSLGSGETTVLGLTTAYAMLINGGKRITPTFVDRIQDRRGKTIFSHDVRDCVNCGPLLEWQSQATPNVADAREQINDPRTVYQMVSILEGVVQRGTATKLKDLKRPLAGKTGTTNDSKDAWFVGFSPDLVVGVYVGYDEPKQLGGRETGASVAVPIFKDFMAEALKDAPIIPFRVPPGVRQVQINSETGARARPGDKRVIWEAFLAGTEPSDKIYILDGSGISLMSSYRRDIPIPEGVDTEMLSHHDVLAPYTQPYSGAMPGAAPIGPQMPGANNNQPQNNQPATTPQAVMSGTGGLY
jgi:penicillin-binding protein 1A